MTDDLSTVAPTLVTIRLVALIGVDDAPLYRDDSALAETRFEVPPEYEGDAALAYVDDQVAKALPHLAALLNQNPPALSAVVQAALLEALKDVV